jgi:integrase
LPSASVRANPRFSVGLDVGRTPMQTLTDRTVRTAKPGRYSDGTAKGLMLVVRASRTRSWVLRYQIGGRRRDMGLGPYPEVSLSDAREKALDARRLIKRDGKDPIAERGRTKIKTFKEAAEALIESKRAGWRNAKHAAQWSSTLKTYVYPKLGALDVKVVDTTAVLEVLRPIWTTRTETASRVRQRIEAILDYATAIKARAGDNPARWRGHLDHLLAGPSKIRAVKHHAALDWRQARTFMTELAKRQSIDGRALAFTILTAARSGEVRGMRWGELDLEGAVWTVPASRIKAGREHRVPLQSAAIALLGEPGERDQLVFPSSIKAGKPLSDATLAAVLGRMCYDVTVHGFRSTFRDWAGETTAHPREVIEAALAHKLKDKAEAAYARGDLFRKRRRLMQDWADYLATAPADVFELHQVPQQQSAAVKLMPLAR